MLFQLESFWERNPWQCSGTKIPLFIAEEICNVYYILETSEIGQHHRLSDNVFCLRHMDWVIANACKMVQDQIMNDADIGKPRYCLIKLCPLSCGKYLFNSLNKICTFISESKNMTELFQFYFGNSQGGMETDCMWPP
jgi:hypothetical protein